MTMQSDVTIVAETGASHGKSYAKSLALIDYAAKAGADAVKFSYFTPDQMTLDRDDESFVVNNGSPWKGEKLFSLYVKSAIPPEWIPELRTCAERSGLRFILGIYHPDTVPKLKDWRVETVKIASFEANWLEFLKIVAESGVKEVILSTGGLSLKEIDDAAKTFSRKKLTLLHCISQYPADENEMDLKNIPDMALRFDVRVGLSDHTTGILAPVAAVAMGAEMIEKHIRLDNDGLDSAFAVTPDVFYNMVMVCRQTSSMLGGPNYKHPKTFHRKLVDNKMVRVAW